MKWFSGREELFDNTADPYQMRNLAGSGAPVLGQLRVRLRDLLHEAHDEFLPGPAYASWFDPERNIVKTGLGPVAR